MNKLDINILIISWRGFSGNSGKPTEKNLYYDAKMSIKWLNNLGINNNKIILYGESLGTGVAVELGQKDNFNSMQVNRDRDPEHVTQQSIDYDCCIFWLMIDKEWCGVMNDWQRLLITDLGAGKMIDDS